MVLEKSMHAIPWGLCNLFIEGCELPTLLKQGRQIDSRDDSKFRRNLQGASNIAIPAVDGVRAKPIWVKPFLAHFPNESCLELASTVVWPWKPSSQQIASVCP
jgi:hypothetical protein